MSVVPHFLTCPAPQRAAVTHLFFDVDDTLTWQGRLPEVAVSALYRAKSAGLVLAAVTGRSFSWGELLVRLFPFDAVVAETGAQALYWRDHQLVVLHHEDDVAVREGLTAKRQRASAKALAQVKGSRLAMDNVGRVADTAFDLVEEGEPLGEVETEHLRAILHDEGLVTARSSVHVNAFAFGPAGPFDKATMVDRLLSARGDVGLDEVAPRLCYVGDSKNDGTLFARAGLSVGVRNVVPHIPALQAVGQAPRFVVDGDGGYGFAAVVDALLDARSMSGS
jgi:HAD superfamily hydrolase (TIGR01484 family)